MTSVKSASTLSTIVFARVSAVGQVGLVVLGAMVTALAAQVTVPWQPVPFTLQTLAVTLCGLALGSRLGALSQLAYLAAGAAGAPVFAGGAFGAHHLVGPTAGYLVSFVAAAWLLGWFAERGWDRSLWKLALALGIGNALILGLGWAYLASFIGPRVAFVGGVVPFLIGAVLKSGVVVASLPSVWKRFDHASL